MYDLIILGAGPAGLTAGLYGARAKLNVLIIEKSIEGGQISSTTDVENYPGYDIINGLDLAMNIKAQAKKFGAEYKMAEVTKVELNGEVKRVYCGDEILETKTIIIANGAKPRLMGVPGEVEYAGKGISYCATCDAPFYQDLEVYVIGGGDSAIDEALFISKFASKVHIVHRRDELRAAKSLQDRVFNNEKIDFIWNSTVEEIKGDKVAEELVLRNLQTNELTSIKSDEPFGIFVFIGYVPETKLYEGEINLEAGYVITDDNMNTNIEGVYAAGDIRVKKLRQVITAAADGAIAAVSAEKYIDEKEGNLYQGIVEEEK